MCKRVLGVFVHIAVGKSLRLTLTCLCTDPSLQPLAIRSLSGWPMNTAAGHRQRMSMLAVIACKSHHRARARYRRPLIDAPDAFDDFTNTNTITITITITIDITTNNSHKLIVLFSREVGIADDRDFRVVQRLILSYPILYYILLYFKIL